MTDPTYGVMGTCVHKLTPCGKLRNGRDLQALAQLGPALTVQECTIWGRGGGRAGQGPQRHPAPPRISHNYGDPITGRSNTSPSLTCSRSEGGSDASSSSRSLQCPQEGQELQQGSTGDMEPQWAVLPMHQPPRTPKPAVLPTEGWQGPCDPSPQFSPLMTSGGPGMPGRQAPPHGWLVSSVVSVTECQ